MKNINFFPYIKYGISKKLLFKKVQYKIMKTSNLWVSYYGGINQKRFKFQQLKVNKCSTEISFKNHSLLTSAMRNFS